MCHGKAVSAFPEPKLGEAFAKSVHGFKYPSEGAENRIAILPDIYGVNPFYQGLSRHLQDRGAYVFLIDPFHGMGERETMSREEGFAFRNKVRDKAFLDDFQAFIEEKNVTGVIGFCLGGLYVFELARRGVKADLLGLYGFPNGLPNEDGLPVPFDYLTDVTTPFEMLMGAEDASVGPENVAKLAAMSDDVPAMTLEVYEGVGHGFLPMLDSESELERAVAKHALSRVEALASGQQAA